MIVLLALMALSVLADNNQELDKPFKQNHILMLSNNYKTKVDEWVLLNVVTKDYEALSLSKEVEELLNDPGGWFWDPIENVTYIRRNYRTYFSLRYSKKGGLEINEVGEWGTLGPDDMLMVPHFEDDSVYIDTEIIRSGNFRYPYYYNVSLFDKKSSKKYRFPSESIYIIRFAYCGDGLIFSRIINADSNEVIESYGEDKSVPVIWNYKTGYFNKFIDRKIIGFGKGHIVTTSKDYYGLSLLDYNANIVYHNNEISFSKILKDVRYMMQPIQFYFAYFDDPFIYAIIFPGYAPADLVVINTTDGEIWYSPDEPYGIISVPCN